MEEGSGTTPVMSLWSMVRQLLVLAQLGGLTYPMRLKLKGLVLMVGAKTVPVNNCPPEALSSETPFWKISKPPKAAVVKNSMVPAEVTLFLVMLILKRQKSPMLLSGQERLVALGMGLAGTVN